MFSGTTQLSHQVCQVFLSFLCVFLCVWLRWIKQGCRLLFASHIGLNVIRKEEKKKRKMWSKKFYLKSNISCDAHLLTELLETDVSWDDAIVVLADKLRKLWDSLNVLRSSLCERRLEITVLRPALLPVRTARFTQFFRQVWRHTLKSLSLTECIGRCT
jgi:hypothetical protein